MLLRAPLSSSPNGFRPAAPCRLRILDVDRRRRPAVPRPMGVISSSVARPAVSDAVRPLDSTTTRELRDRWRKAEARTELFGRSSLIWREAREEADAARRAYEQRLRTLSKKERSEEP